MKFSIYQLGLLIVGAGATSVLHADSVIGVVSTRGSIEVNHAAVRGNASVSEGTSIRTNETAGQVNLQNGVQVTLGARSAAAIHSSRLQLTEGGAQLSGKGNFDVEALGFSIRPENGQAIARVTYENPGRILISALNGPVRVASPEGMLLASVGAGTTYFFEPGTDDPPANTPTKKAPAKVAAQKTAQLSTRAKWGIIGGVAAAGTAVGLGTGLTGGNASR